MPLAFVLVFSRWWRPPRGCWAGRRALTAVAQASARPRECVSARGGQAPMEPTRGRGARPHARPSTATFWRRVFPAPFFARQGARDCRKGRRASSPGRAGPAVLRGRAYANKKSWEQAREAFEKARALDPRSLEDPLTMREWARALARVGRASDALAVYRTLCPRLSALSSPDDSGRARSSSGRARVFAGTGGSRRCRGVPRRGQAAGRSRARVARRCRARLALD